VATTKISIAIDEEELRLARKAAKAEGSSLSRYIARAIGRQLEDSGRLAAARALWREWGESSVATPDERAEILAKLQAARPKRRRRAA